MADSRDWGAGGLERAVTYIHGTSEQEQRRLSALNATINEVCLGAVRPRVGERVVDFGCGLGQFTALVRRGVGSGGCVVAFDAEPRQLDAAREGTARDLGGLQVEWRLGTVQNPPLRPQEAGQFDLAHARFVLEHVSDPETVVGRMAEAVRPGGRVVLIDDDHDVLRLFPAVPSVEGVWRAYIRAYEAAGKDPYIGRKLPRLLEGAGLRPTRAEWLFFGACRGEERFEPLVENMAVILEGAARALCEQGVSEGELRSALKELRAWKGAPGAALWYAMCFAEGEKPIHH